MRAHLILKDGTIFGGRSPLGFGGSGEAVFTTAHAGYQEILTDPSFAGQMVCMTFPEQGVYGMQAALDESRRPLARGFLCRRLTTLPGHALSESDLGSWLRRHRVPVLTELDTRALTLHLRDAGAQPALLWTEGEGSLEEGVRRAAVLEGMEGRALAASVSCRERHEVPHPSPRFRVAVLDGGIKTSILRQLHDSGLHLEVFPWDAPAAELTAARFDGLFISNGPGDPAALPAMAEEVARCLGRLPIFGICLGHQLLARAMGGDTYKLRYGHRGANHPVLDLATGKVEITTQNHGFAVREEGLPPELEVTHRHLSDGTVEGLRHRTLPIFCLQHHPEASPGPHDAHGAFQAFLRLMEGGRP